MSPEAISIVEKLTTMGGQATMLFVACYYLARTLKSQYDSRITSLEERSAECEKHRMQLGKEIREMQSERIGLLETLLRDRAEE
jgi:uncharacterized protein YeeX (DUF496 family)